MDGIRIEVANDGRFEEVIDHVYNDFYPRERLQSAAGLNAETFFELRDFLRKFLGQGLSWIAIDDSTDRVVAIAINSLLKEPFCWDLPSKNRGQRAIVTAFERLEKDVDVFQKYSVTEGLELSYLGVREGYEGRGLARQLTQRTVDEAQRRGLQFVQSVPTCSATIGLFERMGFETLSEISFVDHFIVDGEPFSPGPAFPLARPDDSARFVVKLLHRPSSS